tara:strand:- start:84 stop:269 length:186 start_codon:yes stop_codon:yes gene_type:complete
MNKSNNFDDLNKEFNEVSKNLTSVFESLIMEIQSFDKNSFDTDEILELIQTYKNKITTEEE